MHSGWERYETFYKEKKPKNKKPKQEERQEELPGLDAPHETATGKNWRPYK